MKKENKGITLIALVITIIVLLILAGVTVVTLTGDNGLLQKAQSAGEQSKVAETEEQIKLIYAEYQISKYAEGNTSAGEYLKEQLEKTYGEGNVDIISQEESIVLKITANGESKFYEYNPSTSISKELQKGINYNGKKASEIIPGDDIIIVTEKFKVFAVENNTIKAIPYYNITLTDTPIQSMNAEEIEFSSEMYWTAGEDEIDMNNSSNKIQPYIENYKKTLLLFNASHIDVRIGRYKELSAEGVTNNMRSPGGPTTFWLGSCASNNAVFVYYAYGSGISDRIYNSACYGVRPIIEIPIE